MFTLYSVRCIRFAVSGSLYPLCSHYVSVYTLTTTQTLDGAGDGIKRYMDFSNWEELSDSPLWMAAIGQCFFSLGVCMGIMTAFGSYNPVDQDIATDEKVISFLDVGASLMSGFVVYCILGFLAKTTGDDSWYESGGAGLVFGAFPVAIAEFKGMNIQCLRLRSFDSERAFCIKIMTQYFVL